MADSTISAYTALTGANVDAAADLLEIVDTSVSTNKKITPAELRTGMSAQPLDAELTAIAGLTSAADKFPYFTGSGTAALADLTSAARSVLDDASVSAMRSTIGAAASGAATSSGLTMSTSRLLGRTTGGSGAIEEISVDASLSLAGGVLSVVGGGGGGVCIHPDSMILMCDGSGKWLRDIRIGDKVKGRNGESKVTGIYTNTVNDRPVICINDSLVCTVDHLIALTNGEWASYDPKMYEERTHNKAKSVKVKKGFVGAHCDWASPKGIKQVVIGTKVLASDGEAIVIKIDMTDYFTNSQPVMTLLLDGSDIFFADGIAVAALGQCNK